MDTKRLTTAANQHCGMTAFCLGCLLFTILQLPATAAAPAASDWTRRVIPLPKQMQVDGVVTAAANEIALGIGEMESSVKSTLQALLQPWIKGRHQHARLLINIRVCDWSESGLPAGAQTLATVPNRDQGYTISHDRLNGRDTLQIQAGTPQGALNGARTLCMLVRPPEKPAPDTILILPLLTVTDWPDMADRGTWGSYGYYNLEWYSRWKLNLFEYPVNPNFVIGDNQHVGDHLPLMEMQSTPELVRLMAHGNAHGIKVVPCIPHIGDGQMKLIRDISTNSELAFARDVLAQSAPGKNNARGLCMSNKRTIQFLAECMILAARLSAKPRNPVSIWLTEGGNLACYCDNCRGQNGYLLEVQGILQAAEIARQREPELQLQLMNSQGSYTVDRQVLATLPRNIGFVYYNGFRCYSADHQQMIPDYLADFARSGRYVSAYMDANPSFFAVFPGSMPQFIQFRAQEFYNKGLSGIVAYCVPDRHFYEVNLAALAEWSWNVNGRSVEDFAKAFADIMGICNPDKYAAWIKHAGPAAWWLADSRFIEALCYKPAAILNPIVQQYPEGDVRMKVYPIPELDQILDHARIAVHMAKQSDNHLMRFESACVLAGLKAYKLADDLRHDKAQNLPAAELDPKIRKLEIHAGEIRAHHDAWYHAVIFNKATQTKSSLYPLFGKDFGETYKVPRLSLPEYALFRAADAWRSDLKLPIPVAENGLQPIFPPMVMQNYCLT